MLNKLGQGVKIAEQGRDTKNLEGFVADLFRGKTSFEKISFWTERPTDDWVKESDTRLKLKKFFKDKNKVDTKTIEETGNIPEHTIRELSEMGMFALKVPESYGGLGLSQTAYVHVLELLANYCSSIAILVSADNTIGCKFPVLNYGTAEQKEKYLPELITWPSGFCFTEKDVGSDPASMKTYAMRVKDTDGKTTGYTLNGWKWYTTNAPYDEDKPLAKYLAVVAKIVDLPKEVETTKCFGLFIVPTGSTSIEVGPRNEFCGMRGIYNSNPRFTNVCLEKDQLIGEEGQGFKIALGALNTGRIAIAGSCVAIAKKALDISLWWSRERKQWGSPIGEKELIGSGKLAPAAADILATRALTEYACARFDEKKDVRLEAAICKVASSEKMWRIVDDMMQIRGGRGYETSKSLSSREPDAPPVEMIFRDARPNTIFEGSTQILSQWSMREGMDDYLKMGQPLLEKGNWLKKVPAIAYFTKKYLSLLFSSLVPANIPQDIDENLKEHLKFVDSCAKKFARTLIACSARYRGKMLYKQLTLDRLFWIVVDLYAMSAVCAYTHHLKAPQRIALADLFCRNARIRIEDNFRSLKNNNDNLSRKVANDLLKGSVQTSIF